ncbi:MAG: CvpA family protein [Lachnospiraceae bacterium]|nr:CvpA family protein [Lachnospiraceae bacterium]
MNEYLIGLLVLIVLFAILGRWQGLVNLCIPVICTVASIVVVIALKTWAFRFLFQWAFFSGKNILVRVVVVLLCYALAVLAFRVCLLILRILTKLPIIHGVDKTLGMVAGALIGACVALFLAAVLVQFHVPIWNEEILAQAESSGFWHAIVYENPFAQVAEGIFGLGIDM